jgi:hypothetical protein
VDRFLGTHRSDRRRAGFPPGRIAGLSVPCDQLGAGEPAGRGPEPATVDQDFLVFFFPILGKRFFTAALTFFCSAGVPF